MCFTQTMGYVHKEIASPFIAVQKGQGIQPATKPLHFLFMPSKSLFHYNTIPYLVILQCFLLQGKYNGKILGLTQYHGFAKLLANAYPKKISRGLCPRTPFFSGALPRTPRQGERVYSNPRLQSQLNNISGFGILGSTTNINKWGIPFVAPISPYSNQFNYIIVYKDQITKWVEFQNSKKYSRKNST